MLLIFTGGEWYGVKYHVEVDLDHPVIVIESVFVGDIFCVRGGNKNFLICFYFLIGIRSYFNAGCQINGLI